jgi:hypothetical protein
MQHTQVKTWGVDSGEICKAWGEKAEGTGGKSFGSHYVGDVQLV